MSLLEKEWDYFTEDAKRKIYNIMVNEGISSIDLAVEILLVREGDTYLFQLEGGEDNVRG